MSTYRKANATKGSTGTVHAVIVDQAGVMYAKCDSRKQLRGAKETVNNVTCDRCNR
jgi:hypothetical protein